MESRSGEQMAAGAPDSADVIAGAVVRVRGSVVDVAFAAGGLPALNEALVAEGGGGVALLIEVQDHLDRHTIRAVAMQNTAGLRRGAAVRKTGGPITVPVGEQVLGRLINVVGEPIDELGAFAADVPRWPIHRAAPVFSRQDPAREVFETGIKVIDLLAPLARGGKAGLFGGARRRQDRADYGIDSDYGREVCGDIGFRRHRRALARGARTAG